MTGGGEATESERREWQASVPLCRLSLLLELRFGVDGNGPDEAQQFAAHGGDDLRFLLACCGQFLVTGVEPPLRFPNDVLYLLIEALLPLACEAGAGALPRWEEIWAGPEMKLVGPLAACSPRLRLALALEIERHCRADEILQGRLLNLVAFVDVNGAPGSPAEAGVE